MKLPSTPPVIVIGMHRSGTSLLVRLLGELGVFIGKELDVHDEAWCFKDTNKDLLALAGAHWAKPQAFVKALRTEGFVARCQELVEASFLRRLASYGDATRAAAWGWRDPRNTVTLPIWRERFPDAKVIHVVRNGLDVAMSLHRREVPHWLRRSVEKRIFPPTIGACYRLWKVYVGLGRSHEKSHPGWLSVRYEDLLCGPAEELGRIAEFAGIKLADGQAERVARRHIGRPTRRSRLETIRLRFLTATGLLALDGYEATDLADTWARNSTQRPDC